MESDDYRLAIQRAGSGLFEDVQLRSVLTYFIETDGSRPHFSVREFVFGLRERDIVAEPLANKFQTRLLCEVLDVNRSRGLAKMSGTSPVKPVATTPKHEPTRSTPTEGKRQRPVRADEMVFATILRTLFERALAHPSNGGAVFLSAATRAVHRLGLSREGAGALPTELRQIENWAPPIPLAIEQRKLLLHEFYVGALEAFGPVIADDLLANAVHAAESTQAAARFQPARYL